MIIGSGNVVHNLQRLDWRNHDSAEDWAYRFEDAAVGAMENRPGDILELQQHPDYALAVPTPDHFLPLLYAGPDSARTTSRSWPIFQTGNSSHNTLSIPLTIRTPL